MIDGQINIDGVGTPAGGDDAGFTFEGLVFDDADTVEITDPASTPAELDTLGVPNTPTTPSTPTTKAPEPAPQVSQINYKEVLLDMFDASSLPTLELEEDGEVRAVSISDIDELDHETYLQVLKTGIETLKEDAVKDKVTLSSLSPFLQNAITAEKEGLSSKPSVDFYTEHEKPLEAFDMDTEDGQEAFLIHYRQKYHNDSERTAKVVVNAWKQDGELEQKVKDADSSLKTWIQAQADKQKEDLTTAAKTAKENLVKFVANAKSTLDTFELNQKAKDLVLEKMTRVVEGNRYEIDALYLEARKDPEKSALLAFFLSQPEEFKAQIASKKVTENQIKTGKTIRILKSGEGVDLNNKSVSASKPSTNVKSKKAEEVEAAIDAPFTFG